MIDDDLKYRWYESCQEFYLNSNESKKAAIGLFESLSPQNSEYPLLIPDGEIWICNDIKLAGFDSTFYDSIRTDPKLWYELSEIKNRARSDCHIISSQRRIKALQENVRKLDQDSVAQHNINCNSSTNPSVSWTYLRKYLRYLTNKSFRFYL